MRKRARGGVPVFLFFLSLLTIFPVSVSWGGADSSLFCSAGQLDCESSPANPDDDLKLNFTYLKGYISDTDRILRSPGRWDNKDWTAAALVLSVTAGFYAYDQDLKEWFQGRRNGTSDDITNVLNPFGNPLYTLPALGLAYLYGANQENDKAKRISLWGAESIIISDAFTAVIKFAGRRSRPDTGDRYNHWDGPGISTDNLSFPSQHASMAFSLATVVASESEGPYVAPLAYGIASLIAISRLNDNDHWSSDAFFGAAVGYFTAKAVLRYHKKKDASLTLLPAVSGDHYGVLVSYRF